MKRIDTSKWKEFRVGDLFEVHPTRAYKLTNKALLDGGNTPVVVNSSYNNGIGGYSSKEPTEKGGMITFSDTVDAYTIFYQDKDFVGYPHVQGLYPIGEYANLWSEYSLKFFATVFRQKAINNSFDYSYKFRRDIAINLEVLLPITSSGTPDWEFMENYMREKEQQTSTSVKALNRLTQSHKHKRVDTSEWVEFPLNELFDIKLSEGDNKANLLEDGQIPLISSGSFNNGIAKYIKEGDGKSKMFEGNVITVDMFGKAFYQNKPFFAVSHGRVNILEPKFANNNYIGLFISSIVDSTLFPKYNFVMMCNQSQLQKEKIKLPSTSSGEPDWDLMEQYMRQVEQQVQRSIIALTAPAPQLQHPAEVHYHINANNVNLQTDGTINIGEINEK